MNAVFKELSLLAGGSHYPTINPDMQQRFGKLVVERIVKKIDAELQQAYDYEEPYAIATLQALVIDILDEFDMELHEDTE